MYLENLRDYLRDSGAVKCPNENVYIHNMPESVKQGVLFRPPMIGNKINYELPCFRRTTFRTIVRHENYKGGLDMAFDVLGALTFTEKRVGDNYYYYCRPITEPIAFPQSEGDFTEFLIEYEVNYYEIT